MSARSLARWLPVSLTIVGCTAPDAAPPSRCGGPALERPLFALESDEAAASAVGLVSVDGCLREVADVAFGGDASLSIAQGRPFVCNRSAGVCREIDPVTLSERSVLATTSALGERSNPHDLDLDDEGRAWITRYDQASLAIVGRAGALEATVDLSSLADADGKPEMEAIRIVGGRAYVTLERLDASYRSVGPGVVAVLDVASQKIAGSFALRGENPFGRMRAVGFDATGLRVTVVTPGSFDDASSSTSGVELVDLEAGPSTLVLREVDVGGSITDAVLVTPTEGYAIAAGTDADNPTWVVEFNPSDGTVGRVLADTRPLEAKARGYFHWGLDVDGDWVVVGDRSRQEPRYRFFRRSDAIEGASLGVQLYPPAAIDAR